MLFYERIDGGDVLSAVTGAPVTAASARLASAMDVTPSAVSEAAFRALARDVDARVQARTRC